MSLRFPKPEPAARIRARDRAVLLRARSICVLEVHRREMSRCQNCGTAVCRASDPGATEWTVGHVHEAIPRSRGGDPTDPANCVLLCPACHRAAHRLTTPVPAPTTR